MPHVVRILRRARKQLENLDREHQERIRAEIDRLEETPRHPGVKKLTSTSGVYRARVGTYRIIFQIDDAELIVRIVEIVHRRDAY